MKNKKIEQFKANKLLPFVSICTPTFNRRPFFQMIIKCFENQTYPKERMEWIIIDDGTDKIEDLVKHIPQVRYFKYDNKMTLGKKRNLMHEKSKGDIIVYMDDDDYYPKERVSHAVDVLKKNPSALCAGSSEMYIYFKHIQKMYKFGPYGPNHATAATFAFRRNLLNITKYNEEASLAEEREFLKDYSIPFVQLDPMKTILVFSHIHNSFDKKTLLLNPNDYVVLSEKSVDEFIIDSYIKDFFMNTIDMLLTNYIPGRPENKPDVLEQIKTLTNQRNITTIEMYEKKINEQAQLINSLINEKNIFTAKNNYLENKIKEIITNSINEKMQLQNK